MQGGKASRDGLCPPSGQTVQCHVGSAVIRNQEPREAQSAREAEWEILGWEWRWGASWMHWQCLGTARTDRKRFKGLKASKTALLIPLVLWCRPPGNLSKVRCPLLSPTPSPLPDPSPPPPWPLAHLVVEGFAQLGPLAN